MLSRQGAVMASQWARRTHLARPERTRRVRDGRGGGSTIGVLPSPTSPLIITNWHSHQTCMVPIGRSLHHRVLLAVTSCSSPTPARHVCSTPDLYLTCDVRLVNGLSACKDGGPPPLAALTSGLLPPCNARGSELTPAMHDSRLQSNAETDDRYGSSQMRG